MIITYDNSQDDDTILPNPTYAFSDFSFQSSVINITNRSFTIIISTDLNNTTKSLTNYGFELSKNNILVYSLGFNHTTITGTTEYNYSYRVKGLDKDQQYKIKAYVELAGETNKRYDNSQTVQLNIADDLSFHTDMSYADIRDLDLSSNGLNMNTVNFENCLVNENTIFFKNPNDMHYYDYDLTADNLSFSVDNGDNPDYNFTTLINNPVYSSINIKNNLKLVRIKQLFRNQNVQPTMISVSKEFLGFVNTPDFYYSNHIGLLNPSIDNFTLTDYISPNGSKIGYSYKLITKNFSVGNNIDITLNQTIESVSDYNDLIRLIQKNNELFWFKKVIVEFDCITNPSDRLTGVEVTFKTSFMGNLEDLDTTGLTSYITYKNVSDITDQYKTVDYKPTNISYSTIIFSTAGTTNIYITPNSFSKYNLLFIPVQQFTSINVIENTNQIQNTVPVINVFNKNITNRSTTLGCDIILSGNTPITEVGIYVSSSDIPRNGTQYILEKNGELIKSQKTTIDNVIRNTRRIYPLLKNTTYYVSAYIIYTVNSVSTTIETPVISFTTEPQVFNILGLTDLSHADLTQTDSKRVTDSIELTRAITSTSTPFPDTKRYFDYPQTMLDELIGTKGKNDNTSKFSGISPDSSDRGKLRKFLISQYFLNNETELDFGVVTNTFLGIGASDISPEVKVVKNTTKTISMYETGSLKKSVLYKHMDENDEVELLDEMLNTLKIRGPSGPSKEYFFYKNNILMPKPVGIYTSGSIIDCFDVFNILSGYVIKLNSVEVSEYIYATLSGTDQAYYGDTITYKIKLDAITNHTLTFTLSNGQQIQILSNSKQGSVNIQLFTVQTVFVVSVTGGQSHRVIPPSGTVTCNIRNIIATLSTFNLSAYYDETVTYTVTLSYPTNYLLRFTMDNNNNTIDVNANSFIGNTEFRITQPVITSITTVSGPGKDFVTLVAGNVSTTIRNINATLSCSNVTAYYGDTITYYVYLDNPTRYNLTFTMNNNITIDVLQNQIKGSSTDIITQTRSNNFISSVSGPGNNFINLLGTVSTDIIKLNATLSCSNIRAYYEDTITYTVTLNKPVEYNLRFTMVEEDINNNITIDVLANQISGSSSIILTNVRNDKTLSSVSRNTQADDFVDFVQFVSLVGNVSTDIIKLNATLSCSNVTAYYGDTITYTVTLDHSNNSPLRFMLDNIPIDVLANNQIGIANAIITEPTQGKTLSSVSGPPGKDYVNFFGSVTTTITKLNPTLSCSNETAYYGETITYTVTLDKPIPYALKFILGNSISITIDVLENQISGSSTDIITQPRNDIFISSVSGPGSSFINLLGSGSVSTVVNKEILVENHSMKGEIIIPNIYISQETKEEETEDGWEQNSEQTIEHLRELPQKIKNKVPVKGMYSLSGITEVFQNTMHYNFESDDISEIHVKPSHLLSNKAHFHITVRNIIDSDTKVQMFVSGPNGPKNVSGDKINVTGPNFIYTLGSESEPLQPNTTYGYTAELFKEISIQNIPITTILLDTVSGSFKTDEVSSVNNQTLSDIKTNSLQNINNTIRIKYYYTVTQESKRINCVYKCYSSNILTSISDTISWEGTYDIGRFSNEIIKYPLDNKIVEFNVIKANGIYKDIKKVKIHFEDRTVEGDSNIFHMLEFLNN